MTLVWLSPGLPVDRVELADALPAELTLVEPGTDHVGAGVDALPVGSLCVATVFEPDVLHRLAYRPDGIRLLVVGPPGQALPAYGNNGRPVDAVATTSSVVELVAALRQATGWASPAAATPEPVDSAAPRRSRPAWLRGRLAGVAAMLLGLAVGGVVIASTEGAAATAADPRGGPSQVGPPGTGTTGGTGTAGGFEQQLSACLRAKGFTADLSQLRQQGSDPALRAAVQTCFAQMRGGVGMPSAPTGRP